VAVAAAALPAVQVAVVDFFLLFVFIKIPPAKNTGGIFLPSKNHYLSRIKSKNPFENHFTQPNNATIKFKR